MQLASHFLLHLTALKLHQCQNHWHRNASKIFFEKSGFESIGAIVRSFLGSQKQPELHQSIEIFVWLIKPLLWVRSWQQISGTSRLGQGTLVPVLYFWVQAKTELPRLFQGRF